MSAPTTDAIREMDIDIANTARARDWRSLQQPMVEPEDRTLELQLRGTDRLFRIRRDCGLPPRANPKDVATWHAWLNYRFWLARYGRRHPHHPINRALVAH